ncbi:MAG: aspartate/glutamate racemase family protein [Caldilineaceae bacterium]
MQPKLMGILAGMGPRSTAPFIDLVVSECQRQYGAQHDIDFPPMLIYSLPTPFYLDRPLDHHAMEATVCAGLQHLERAGVALIAMPCNTAHIYYAQVARCIQIPLLNMIDIALQHIPPATQRVALLATRPTVAAQLYQTALQSRGINCVSQESWQQQVDALIRAIKTQQAPSTHQALWQTLLQEYAHAAIDTLLIACTDLNALNLDAPERMTILDATQGLAAALVSRWRLLT